MTETSPPPPPPPPASRGASRCSTSATARRLIFAMSAPTYFPSAWRIGAARAIAALPSPVSQYASPTNASLVRRPFNRSWENCTPLIRPPLDATNRPRPSTTSSPSQSGQRSRTELRYSRSRPTASPLVPWILARFSATAYAVAATRRSRSRSPSHSSISHAAWVLVPRRSWAIWSPIDLWLFRDDAKVKASAGTSVATTANTSIWFLMLSRWNSRSQRAMVSCQVVTVGRPPEYSKIHLPPFPASVRSLVLSTASFADARARSRDEHHPTCGRPSSPDSATDHAVDETRDPVGSPAPVRNPAPHLR